MIHNIFVPTSIPISAMWRGGEDDEESNPGTRLYFELLLLQGTALSTCHPVFRPARTFRLIDVRRNSILIPKSSSTPPKQAMLVVRTTQKKERKNNTKKLYRNRWAQERNNVNLHSKASMQRTALLFQKHVNTQKRWKTQRSTISRKHLNPGHE